jgi:hypothetical protein
MKLYLAARYGRRAEMQINAVALERLGHQITARWVRGAHENVEERDCAIDDVQDIMRADALVAFTEGPDTPSGLRARGGRHVEFGFALAQGLRTIVVGPRENVFHHLPGVEQVGSVRELLSLLSDRRALEVG